MTTDLHVTDLGCESLSVVICAYTTARWVDLRRAVESVLAQESPALELILVIDYCDELHDMAVEAYSRNVRIKVMRNNGIRGLSGARNTGVANARGDVVAFLDDDAHAAPDWTSALMRHYVDPTTAGVGGYAQPVWPIDRPGWLPQEFDWVVGCSYIGQPTELAPVRNPIGCNMSLRRSVFDVVGGFSSEVGRVGTTPVGGEETELCMRVLARGPHKQILFDPEMRVHHQVSADRVTLRYFVRRCYHEGLSKAVVAELADASMPLSTERAYVRRVLPRGVIRGIASCSRDGLARAALIVVGLTVTTAGFARAKIARSVQQ